MFACARRVQVFSHMACILTVRVLVQAYPSAGVVGHVQCLSGVGKSCSVVQSLRWIGILVHIVGYLPAIHSADGSMITGIAG